MPAVAAKMAIYKLHLPSGSGGVVEVEMPEHSTLCDILEKATENGRDVSGSYTFMSGGAVIDLDDEVKTFQTTIIASPAQVKGN